MGIQTCPGCGGPLIQPARGRPRTYCSRNCSQRARRHTARLRAQLERLETELAAWGPIVTQPGWADLAKQERRDREATRRRIAKIRAELGTDLEGLNIGLD